MNYNKQTITKIVLNNLPEGKIDYSTISLDKIIFRWYEGRRSGRCWQLTEEGESCFQSAEISYYDFQVIRNKKLKASDFPQILKKIREQINCPYYLHYTKDDEKKCIKLRVYDEKLAMMITLLGGVVEYLNSEVKL